ncbi:hypothetical protein [Serratia sp. Se-RSBMAAmG]|uniref:hypothetical protein n=1 Tax=Serratia sp. Se-RSBMAAmG TaxID=3043305 RepID=UPI0024AFE011|nr:hypothetical protein [Serratia sp. Se-RSBMAAmG]MDI6977134.1 hypothetical protein [Serratia sp. Se-RSBMAAmG]
MTRISMKQSQEHTLMRHDTQRYLLSTPHYIIKSAEKTFDLYQSTSDEALKAQLLAIIEMNKQAYLEQLEIALLFDETGKDESEDPLKFHMHHWLSNVHIFNLHYMDVVAHAIKHTRSISPKDLIVNSLQNDTPVDDLKVLLSNLIANFSFWSIAFVMDFVKTYYPESLEDFKALLTTRGLHKQNFLNLILLQHHYSNDSIKYTSTLSYMDITQFDFEHILLLQDGRINDNKTSSYEIDRFNNRFARLFDSGLFDNDPVITQALFNIPQPSECEKNSIAYLYHGFKTETEKQLLLNMAKARIEQLKNKIS